MLANLRYYSSKLLSNYKYLLILFVILVFLGVGIYAYNTYVSPKLKPAYVPNKEFVNEEETNEVELLFFYTTWCPHCKKAMPIWQKFKEDHENILVNKHKIIFREIDCDKEESLAKQYEVEGYPTIKLIKNDEIIEYDAKPNYETLQEFLQSTI